MCRLLGVKARKSVLITEHLRAFAQIARASKEYQGHGWGCAYINNAEWKLYKNIKPIWEDDLEQFGNTTMLLAHARSAFRNEAIAVENNMPFQRNNIQFIFNGELHGVKLSQTGRIGAEKIFNFMMRFHEGQLSRAMLKGIEIIKSRTRYVRAMNIIMSDGNVICASSAFNEEPDYFTMHIRQAKGEVIVCSEPYPGEEDWQEMTTNNGEVQQL